MTRKSEEPRHKILFMTFSRIYNGIYAYRILYCKCIVAAYYLESSFSIPRTWEPRFREPRSWTRAHRLGCDLSCHRPYPVPLLQFPRKIDCSQAWSLLCWLASNGSCPIPSIVLRGGSVSGDTGWRQTVVGEVGEEPLLVLLGNTKWIFLDAVWVWVCCPRTGAVLVLSSIVEPCWLQYWLNTSVRSRVSATELLGLTIFGLCLLFLLLISSNFVLRGSGRPGVDFEGSTLRLEDWCAGTYCDCLFAKGVLVSTGSRERLPLDGEGITMVEGDRASRLGVGSYDHEGGKHSRYGVADSSRVSVYRSFPRQSLSCKWRCHQKE